MRVIVALVLIIGFPESLLAQRDSAGARRDSASVHQQFYGPPYLVTGNEDSLLLARMFEETFKVGGGDAERGEPAVICLAVGGINGADAPASVLRVLAHHLPPVRPVSACRGGRSDRSRRAMESATGKPAWILSVTALEPLLADTVALRSSYYVAPLWAAGWVCRAVRRGNDWRIFACSMTWIS